MSEQGGSFGIDDSTPTEHDTVTLCAGSLFAILAADGTIRPVGAQGFYADDTRVISELSLRIDGQPLRVMERCHGELTLHVMGSIGNPVAPHLLIDQRVELSDVLTISLRIENLTSEERDVSVDMAITGDFADLFEVKRGERPRGGLVIMGAVDEDLVLRYLNHRFRRGVTVHVDHQDEVLRDGIRVREHVGPHARTDVVVTAMPLGSSARHPDMLTSTQQQRRWMETAPPAPPAVPELVWNRSWQDIGSLLMSDAIEPHSLIVAAGSPWFMALFGRDSLVTSLETLPYRTDLAIGVLRALALRQGTVEDPVTLEQPGRIPHEVRRGEVVQRRDGWGATFFGTVDATPLFVMTLAEAWRRGADPERVHDLLPSAERAVAWILGPGDPDGDGFVEYPGIVHGPAGLANQGWKDSDDAVRHPDGSLARGPIASVEVQGYCHAALVAMADLRDAFGTGAPDELRERAARLQDAVDEQFWLDDEDCYAVALDGWKDPVATVASNSGHLLFTGTATGDRAARLARRLMADDMFTGFGLRTLSAHNGGYNPLSYHCGSVWPHDTALVAVGMLRAGRPEGRVLASALLEAADEIGRLPELFGGFDRSARPRPVPYPTSCSPQAWAAGAPLILGAYL